MRMHFCELVARLVRALLDSRQGILELRHTGNGEEDGFVAHRNGRAAGHEGVVFLFEKLDEFLADLAAFHLHSN
jgi:hypothetical protein